MRQARGRRLRPRAPACARGRGRPGVKRAARRALVRPAVWTFGSVVSRVPGQAGASASGRVTGRVTGCAAGSSECCRFTARHPAAVRAGPGRPAACALRVVCASEPADGWGCGAPFRVPFPEDWPAEPLSVVLAVRISSFVKCLCETFARFSIRSSAFPC